jgi:hypothetical protein
MLLRVAGEDDTSGQFQLVSFDLHGDGTFNAINGDDQLFFAGMLEDSLHAVEASAADPYAAPDFEKGVQRAGNIVLQERLEILNLFGGDGRCGTCELDKMQDAWSTQDACPGFAAQIGVDKEVSGEQRNIDALTPIAPAMNFLQDRSECVETFFAKFGGNSFFDAVFGLNGVPVCGDLGWRAVREVAIQIGTQAG